MALDKILIRRAWDQKCPRCGTGDLYRPGLTLTVRDICSDCGLALEKNDSADGPAVFLIFVLGTGIVPAALLVDLWFAPPIWVHAIIWTIISLVLTVGALRPLKAFIIGLQFKHRASHWSE